ncbi:dnaJ homolog subfamily C member 22-like [Babylonia areolata]|uniref:dnaJ homolog subfamily C member 22-like n=1 Tax=Babylonia areolata TaxID=304850 RepID=UPI003FCF6BE8
MANQVVAYILWFFLGVFGVHHFYLKRDRQAFVWWATLGGVFGLGWIRDFWRLPDYVKETNEEDRYTGYQTENENVVPTTQVTNEANQNRNGDRRPKMSLVRFVGMMTMGYVLGYLVMFLFPQEVFKEGNRILVRTFFLVVPPTAAAAGVHLVGNIGHLHVSFVRCLVGSAVGVFWQLDDPTNIGASCFFSAVSVCASGYRWKPSRRRKSKCRRLTVLFVCGMVYLSMWGSALYFNATVTTKDGESVPLREALNNFFTSPAWTQTKESLYLIWQNIRVNGWRTFYEQLVQSIDPQGETNAYRILGVNENSSQEEIKSRYRKLAKEWHPDKQQDPSKKAAAQEKFLQIQKAYETLSNIKSRRSQKNKRRSHSDEL